MTSHPPPHPAPQVAPIPLAEFVAMVAALMSLGALGIDAMLPALPDIGNQLVAPSANARQYVVAIFMLGLGVGQLVHGPLADRFGRRPVMLWALAIYLVTNAAAALAGDFTLLLAARFAGAVAVSATRVVTIAIVRDCYSGRQMARVMSLATMTFMIVPVLAPTIGTGILLFGSWRAIFAAIAAITTAVMIWFAWRLPETLDPASRQPYAPARLWLAVRQTLGDRWSLGYMLASTLLQAAMVAYLASVQQIVTDVFQRAHLLNVVFALTACGMAGSNLLNSRLVMRIGSRILSQAALVALLLAAAVALALGETGHETLATFVALQALTMSCFSLANANFSAMAMTNMGAIAGTASSVQGFVGITGGALLGGLVGQAYAGTTAPLHGAFLAAGTGALAIVAVTERFRLFRPA